MGVKIELAGKRFGRLKVIEDTGKRSRSKQIIYLCQCDCGEVVEKVGGNLRVGDTKSCGCLKVDKQFKHGAGKTKLYRAWADMLQRCRNKNSSNYKYYGEKGISVISEWGSFMVFRDWAMSNGYETGLSIDRIDPTGNYSPDNCRWATREVQNNNKTSNVFAIVRGKKMTLAQIARKYEFHPSTIVERYKAGDRGEKLIRERTQGVKGTGEAKRLKYYTLDDTKVGNAKWLLSNTKLYQREIAEKCGMSQVYVSQLKRGIAHADVKPVKPEWWDDDDER